jgi:hypothetical protein
VLLDRRLLRIHEVERRLERASLRLRQLRQGLPDHVADQIREPRERIAGLGLGRPARENAVATDVRRLDSREPQRSLADACLAVQDRGGRQLLAGVEESQQRVELLFPADEVLRADGHHLRASSHACGGGPTPWRSRWPRC